MLEKPIGEIEKADIEALVENEVSEGKELEYKSELPGGRDQDRVEYLADVSSFANGGGGHIIYGLGDKRDTHGKSTGVPEYVGLGGANMDAAVQTLEQRILNGVEPRIPGIQIRAIEGFCNGPVVIVRIPKSWVAPHMVTCKNCSRFYSRTSSGKYQLDVREIRTAFALSDTIPERMREFRAERIGRIMSGETPIKLNDGPKIVLHLVPFEAFAGEIWMKINIREVKPSSLPPIYSSGYSHRYNFDGLLTSEHLGDRSVGYCYTQLFRNGSIEALDTYIIQASGDKRALSSGYEEEIVGAVRRYLDTQKDIGIGLPVVVMLSLLGVRGFVIGGVNAFYARRGQDPIDREVLLIPDVIVEAFGAKPVEFMKPIFDAVWNAAGWPRSMNYDENGNWNRKTS